MTRHLIVFITILTCLCGRIAAQERKDSVLINFRQSKVNLDTEYMDNPQALRHAMETIEKFQHPDSVLRLSKVTVVGGASPEGSVKFNEWLSHQRAARIFDYIGNGIELPDTLTDFTFLGRDWEGLRRMVEADPNVPHRADVLATLDEIIEQYHKGEKESQGNLLKIKRLHKGVPYRYMYKRLFPTLRASKLVLTFSNPTPFIPAPPLPPADLDIYPRLELNPILLYAPPKRLKPFYMALKSNMLYDVLAVPNIGAEFYLGKNMSIVGNWMYGWWHSDRKARYWRIYGGDVALRWWFGNASREKPLTGHHIGMYGSLLTYDFEFGGRGYMGGVPRGALWDKCNHLAGIEYGYSLPIARRWNIDFNIGVGYQGGEYQVYDAVDGCYVYRETRHRKYWGPTKAEISIAWLIGRGNENRRF